MDLAAFASIASIAAALCGWLGFAVGKRDSTLLREQELRKQLATHLEEVVRVAESYRVGDRRDSVAKRLFILGQSINRTRGEGLTSPNRKNLRRLTVALENAKESWDSTDVLVPLEGFVEVESAVIPTTNAQFVSLSIRDAELLSRKYLRAMGQMNRGSYLTYLRYKYFPARSAQRRPSHRE